MNGPYGAPLAVRAPQLNTPRVKPLYQRLAAMYPGILGNAPGAAGMLGAGAADAGNLTTPGPSYEPSIGQYSAGTATGRIGALAGTLMGIPGLGGIAGALGTAQDISRAQRDLADLGVGPAIAPMRAYAGAFSPLPDRITASMFGPTTTQQQFNAAVVSRMMPDEYVSQLGRVQTERQYGMTPQALSGILSAYSNDYYGGEGNDYSGGVGAPTGYAGGGYAGYSGGFDA
jgi:hypothetical protein